MRKLIKLQLIVVFILSLVYSMLLLGVLTDVKYTVEASKEVSNRVITTVYNNISNLSVMFFVLSVFLIINSVLLLRKVSRKEGTTGDEYK